MVIKNSVYPCAGSQQQPVKMPFMSPDGLLSSLTPLNFKQAKMLLVTEIQVFPNLLDMGIYNNFRQK